MSKPQPGPQRSELECIRDANANTPQYDPYADDPNVRERFGDERDAEVAVEAAAWRRKLLAAALDELDGFVARYVYFESDAQRTAVVLWVAETHVADAFDVAPYLHIKSPEKQSGKTLLLEVIELTAWEAVLTSNISPAALFRVMNDRHPTLLFDEVDAVFPSRKTSGDPSREELRALINSGYRRGAKTLRVGGPRRDKIEEFDSFGPKGLAGIGELPDTIADRAIPIRLQRKPRSVKLSRWRRRLVKEEAAGVADRLSLALAEFRPPLLSDEWPVLPDQLSDRGQDLWEPLLAVADYAGDEWPSRGRAAAILLHTGADQASETLGIRLLGDLRAVWPDRGDKVFTRELLEALNGLEESPWGDWYGKPITARFLADKLRPYGPTSRKVNIGGTTLQGWRRVDFEDPWNRYLVGDSLSAEPDDGIHELDLNKVITGEFDDATQRLIGGGSSGNLPESSQLMELSDPLPPLNSSGSSGSSGSFRGNGKPGELEAAEATVSEGFPGTEVVDDELPDPW